MSDLVRSVEVGLPYDMRSDSPTENFGIHGLDVYWRLRGPKGAVQFAVTFPVYLPHLMREMPHLLASREIMGKDVGYHSPIRTCEGEMHNEACEVLDYEDCYYDGSTLRAEEWVREIFAVRGSRPEYLLWKMLEQEYISRFGDARTDSQSA